MSGNETEYVTIINHTGKYIDLFKSIFVEDTENLYLATLLEIDNLDQVIEYLLELTADLHFTVDEWMKFTNSFPIELEELIFIVPELMHVELVVGKLSSMVECFLVWYYIGKNYQKLDSSIFDYIPDIDCVLYPDFDEEQIANLSGDDSDSSDSSAN